VDDRWRVKITDFGLSRARQATYVSASGQGGTPEWMAPEVLCCGEVAEPADVYSYGVVLWELLSREAPWEGYNPMQVSLGGGGGAWGPLRVQGLPAVECTLSPLLCLYVQAAICASGSQQQVHHRLHRRPHVLTAVLPMLFCGRSSAWWATSIRRWRCPRKGTPF
jgi:serine/threonine protein kinase